VSKASQVAELDDRPDAGFTLVELLAAIGLLSLVSVILLGSLHFGIKAWGRGTAHTVRVDHAVLVQGFLRRAIEDAYPYFTAETGTRGHVQFEGTADALRLLASTSHALGSGGRSRLSLAVSRGRQGVDLVVVATPELGNDAGAGNTAMKVLLANVQAVELSYFGKGRSDRQAVWRDRWTGEPRLPELVRIEVSFPSGDRRIWPTLIVAPRIGADVGCVYDPLTKRCRGR
jgi:general secretion pathway protein J